MRIPRHNFPAVYRGFGQLGRNRCQNDRKPGSQRTHKWPFDADWIQKFHRRICWHCCGCLQGCQDPTRFPECRKRGVEQYHRNGGESRCTRYPERWSKRSVTKPHWDCVWLNVRTGPNYAAEFVKDCGEKLKKADLPQKIMVSHHNLAGASAPLVHSIHRHFRSTAVTATVKNNTKNNLTS